MSVFYVMDMNCSHCERRIAEALNDAGIEGFVIDLANKKVTAPGDAGKIAKILDDAGYTAQEATV